MEDKKITVSNKIIRNIVDGETTVFHMSNGETITIKHVGDRILIDTAYIGIKHDEFNREIVIMAITIEDDKPQTKKKNKFRFKT